MDAVAATYTLEKLLSDSSSILSTVLTQMTQWFGFFTSNSALLWVFIGGVAMLSLKLIRGLF